jgi:hypothetical protein
MIAQINVALAAEGRFAVEKIFPQGLKPILLFASWRHGRKRLLSPLFFNLRFERLVERSIPVVSVRESCVEGAVVV